MFDWKNIKKVYDNVSEKVKDFLLSAKSREFLIFLGFFLIAGSFWLLLTLNDEYEADFSIPVRLRGIPNNVVVTSEPVANLRVRLKDKGTTLLNYKLGKSFFPIILNFTDYESSNNHVRIYSADFDRRIQNQLNPTTRLLTIRPDTLDYIYSEGSAKMVPVVLQGNVTAGRQYYIADTIFSPDSVVVYAPSNMLDTIRFAYTENINVANITDTFKYEAIIRQPRGIKIEPPVVNLTFPVDVYTDKTVEVPLVGVDFPPNTVLRTFPSRIKVTFQIGLSRYNDINAQDFTLTVSYNELMRTESDKYRVRLITAPEGVTNIRLTPEEVDFLIEQVSTNGN